MEVDGLFLVFGWKWPQGAPGEQSDVVAKRRNSQLQRVSQLISVKANTVSSLSFALQAALCFCIANFLTLKQYVGNTVSITRALLSCYLAYVNKMKQHQDIKNGDENCFNVWVHSLRWVLLHQTWCCKRNSWAISFLIWSRRACIPYLFIYDTHCRTHCRWFGITT